MKQRSIDELRFDVDAYAECLRREQKMTRQK
nr:MAG TPA: hypothetical protein [Caudoviricetes sp.]